jgi:Sep-tRNA:Cys-tRNA synthetase
MVAQGNLQRYERMWNRYKDCIVIHPIMTGGILPDEVQKRVLEERWARVGYAVCFDCLEGRSSLIAKPPVREFLDDIAGFFGGDVAEHTFGCRAAQFAVMKTISDYLDGEGARDHVKVVVTDPLCHYTTAIAAEMTGFRLVEPPYSGYPEYKIEAKDFVGKIEEIRKETGKLPGLIAVTHVEPYYGNMNPAKEIGEIAKEYEIPYMVNAAYTAGVLPVDMRDLQADFLTVSAHKSMASLGPLGFLVTNYGWAKRAFKKSAIMTDWSGRAFGKKLPNLFGCSVGGIALISAMCSFPYVVKRVKKWNEELRKIRWFTQEMEKLDDIMLIGERPHRHHLLHFETPIFWEISKHHKRKGFFLADEMIQRGIVGLHRGLSKHVKLSIYGLSWDEVKRVRDAFYEIAEKYAGEFNLAYTFPKAPAETPTPRGEGAK